MPSIGIKLDYWSIVDKATRSNQRPQPYRVTILLLLVLGGDIEINPGPVKYPCKICTKPVAKTHRALQCDECDQWVHIKCGNVTADEYESLGKSSAIWICYVCRFANYSTSIGSDDSLLSNDNSFAVLSDDGNDFNSSDKEENNTDSSSINSDTSCSTKDSQRERQELRSKPKFRRLKLMSINCRGLKSKRKQRDLHSAIQQEDPDIICGNESHVDENYHTSEVFPDNYIFRNDRNRYGGGVFLGLRKDLLGMKEDRLQTDSESIWVKIIFAGKQPLYVGSMYRPTDENTKALEELDKALKKLTTRNSLPNILLLGDFNTPDINWSTNSIIKRGKINPSMARSLTSFSWIWQTTTFLHKSSITQPEETVCLIYASPPCLIKLRK